jgi:hypothetical protein
VTVTLNVTVTLCYLRVVAGEILAFFRGADIQSAAGLLTDRAAFEILEWARNTGTNIRMIVSTSKVTPERQRAARALGAVGIGADTPIPHVCSIKPRSSFSSVVDPLLDRVGEIRSRPRLILLER